MPDVGFPCAALAETDVDSLTVERPDWRLGEGEERIFDPAQRRCVTLLLQLWAKALKCVARHDRKTTHLGDKINVSTRRRPYSSRRQRRERQWQFAG